MNSPTVIIPIVVIILISYWFFKVSCLGRPAPLPKHSRTKLKDSPFVPDAPEYRMVKKDVLPLFLVTAVYAFFAFFMLGDTEAPQSVREFEAGDCAVFDFGETVEIDEIMYYTSLYTGTYALEYSIDGENFIPAFEMSQAYNELFRWMDLSFEESQSLRYLRIVANDRLDMAELAFLTSDGEYIVPSYVDGDAALFDEQDIIPENGYSYMNSTYFDEIYHPRTALEHLNGITPYEISHPPLGKIIMSIGIDNLGMTPFGWRFMGTLFGVLMLPVLYILVKLMFGSAIVSTATTFIFAFDFMHFVQTRIATIDTYGVFFILLSFLFMFMFTRQTIDRSTRLRRLLPLALCGITWGVGCASKWTVIYAGAGLAVIWLGYWIVRLRALRLEAKMPQFWREFLGNCAFCVLFFIVAPLAIYYASYYPYGVALGLDGVSMFFDPTYFDTVIENQKFMFSYHSDLVATHPYSSRWWQWVLNLRPILYYLDYYTAETKSAFGAFGGPVLYWGGLLSMLFVFWRTVAKRDFKAFMISVGYLASLLPWVFIDRLTFAYHYFPCTIFLALAIAYILSLVVSRTANWRPYVYSACISSAIFFIMFYPVLTGLPFSVWYTNNFLRWIPSAWPF